VILRRLSILAAASSSLCATTLARAEPSDKEQCVTTAEQAQPLRRAGRLLDARERLLVCASATCPRVVRSDCTTWLASLDGEIPTIVIRAHDDRGRDMVDVRVTVDGKRVLSELDGKPLPIDPGKHVLHYAADGLRPVEDTVLIVAGEKNRPLLVTFASPQPSADEGAATPRRVADPKDRVGPPAPEPGSSPPVLGYALLGLGVVAAGSFSLFELVGQNEYATLRDGCAATHSCSQSGIDTAKAHLLMAGVSLAVAATALVAGGIVVFTSKRATSAASVEIGPASVGASVRF
jgi:hypothetical protein